MTDWYTWGTHILMASIAFSLSLPRCSPFSLWTGKIPSTSWNDNTKNCHKGCKATFSNMCLEKWLLRSSCPCPWNRHWTLICFEWLYMGKICTLVREKNLPNKIILMIKAWSLAISSVWSELSSFFCHFWWWNCYVCRFSIDFYII